MTEAQQITALITQRVNLSDTAQIHCWLKYYIWVKIYKTKLSRKSHCLCIFIVIMEKPHLIPPVVKTCTHPWSLWELLDTSEWIRSFWYSSENTDWTISNVCPCSQYSEYLVSKTKNNGCSCIIEMNLVLNLNALSDLFALLFHLSYFLITLIWYFSGVPKFFHSLPGFCFSSSFVLFLFLFVNFSPFLISFSEFCIWLMCSHIQIVLFQCTYINQPYIYHL